MYGYTFAVAQEGGGEAAITIMDIVPWKHAVEVRSKLVLREVRCNTNFCFEGITYDVYKNVFYAVQEMDPMKVWMITPSGRATEMLNSQTRFPGMRDLADTYLDPLSSRLFVVSQTEQKVAELSWDGEVKQIIPVEDNMVEGLTFTPDGDLMITVGEPNDLWVYTSTGDCDWHPEEQETRPEPAAQQNPLQLPIPVDEDIDGGYCSWESCKRVRQGSPWCHGKIENCVRGCGGIWCWWNAVGGVISKEDLPEVPAAAPENIRSTALLTREWVDEAQQEAPHEDSVARKGFCTWSSCSFGQQAEAWCSQSPYNCVKFCEGSYCWADGLDPPITASNIDKANSTSATQVRDTSTTTNILARPTGRAAEAELSQVSQPTSLSAEEPELQTNIGKRFVEILDNTFVDGFKAQVTVALHGIAVWQFTPLQQLYFREVRFFLAPVHRLRFHYRLNTAPLNPLRSCCFQFCPLETYVPDCCSAYPVCCKGGVRQPRGVSPGGLQ